MKVLSKYNLILTMISLIIIAGCGPVDVKNNNLDYMHGTQGIEVDFMANSMPDKIYEGMPLNLVVDVKNLGTYNEPYGKVYLRGFDSNIMPFDGRSQNGNYVKKDLPRVEAINAYNQEGGYDMMSFDIDKNSIYFYDGERYEPSLMLSTCYYYETLATPTVCIVPDVTQLTKEKLCNPEEDILLQSQGAPVAVTKVEEQIMNDFVNFIVTIKNVGNGKVVIVDEYGYEACPLDLDYNDLNTVFVNMEINDMPKPECTPERAVKLVNGEGQISCRFQINPQATPQYYYNSRTNTEKVVFGNEDVNAEMYTQQLKINLEYLYNTNSFKKITIEKMPGTYSIEQDLDYNDEPDTIDEPNQGPEYDECTCEDSIVDGVFASGCVCLYYKADGQTDYKMHRCKMDGTADLVVSEQSPDLLIDADNDGDIKTCSLHWEDSQAMVASGSCKDDNYVLANPTLSKGLNKFMIVGSGEPGASIPCIIEYDG